MKKNLGQKIKTATIIGLISLSAGALMNNEITKTRALDAEVGYVRYDLETYLQSVMEQELNLARSHFSEIGIGIRFSQNMINQSYDVYKLNDESEYEKINDYKEADSYIKQWHDYARAQAIENSPEIVAQLKAEYAALGDKVYDFSSLQLSAGVSVFLSMGLLSINGIDHNRKDAFSKKEQDAEPN